MKQLSTTIAILALATSSAAFAQGVSFATFDTDGDGVISKEEASANMQLEKLFPELDSDGNGELSKEEFAQIQQNLLEKLGTFTSRVVKQLSWLLFSFISFRLQEDSTYLEQLFNNCNVLFINQEHDDVVT